MDEQQVRKALEAVGAIYDGHFVGTSTKHLGGYCNNDLLMPHAAVVGQLAKQLVMAFKDDNIETVATPAIGAIPLAHWGAHHLMEMTGKDVLGVWADKIPDASEKTFIFERDGYLEAIKGKRVLLLEDIINQMSSIKAMIKTVTEAGGIIVGVGSLEANKGVSAEVMGVPKFVKLCTIEYDAWTAEDCAVNGLCAKNEPIVTDIGHGDDFQKAHPGYKGGYVQLLEK
jgi:orotate phosphoribosyltransferase